MTTKVYIRAFGCQMNVKDTERMLGFMMAAGCEPTDDPAAADVLIANTCSVREKPEKKIFDLVGRWRIYKEERRLAAKAAPTGRPPVVIGVAGCVAQQHGQAMLDQLPALDLVIGTRQVHRIAELVARAQSGERIAAVDLPDHDPDLFAVPDDYAAYPVSAFLSIMQGCDNCCAYCIVPAVRGPAASRPAAAVLAEAQRLAGRGVRELTLLGQNVNAWRDGAWRDGAGRDGGDDFPGLLRGLAAVDGIERIRFTTSHPKDLSERLIEAMAREAKVMEAIHLPVQAGADRTLAAMNRGYGRDHYLGLVERLRAAMPDIGITTDLIVGFPGETAADFEDTLSLVSAVRYDETFSFRYSIRPGTRAADLPGQVAEEEKYQRLYRLQDLQRKITEAKNEEQVGITAEVLVEGPSKTDPGRQTGRSRQNRLVHFAGDRQPGAIIKVRITTALKHSLLGEPASAGPSRPAGGEEEACLLR